MLNEEVQADVDITMILDRSGSMGARLADAQGAFDAFIKEQKEQPGKTNFTLIQFDGSWEEVYTGDIKSLLDWKIQPRGMTALLDAVGNGIVNTGQRLRLMAPEKRPKAVIFVILTDGEENSSREYAAEQVAKMTEHQRDVYNWQFIYLGANQDAFSAAKSIGIPQFAAANYSAQNVGAALSITSAGINCARSAVLNNEPVKAIAYSDADRKAMEEVRP